MPVDSEGFGFDAVLATWEDDDAQKLEMCMTDIAVQVILTGEVQYREGTLRQHRWRVQRKVEATRLAQARDRSSSIDELEQWSQPGLAQADRIDPAIKST